MKEYVRQYLIHRCEDDSGSCAVCGRKKGWSTEFESFLYTVDGYEGRYCWLHARYLAVEYREEDDE